MAYWVGVLWHQEGGAALSALTYTYRAPSKADAHAGLTSLADGSNGRPTVVPPPLSKLAREASHTDTPGEGVVRLRAVLGSALIEPGALSLN